MKNTQINWKLETSAPGGFLPYDFASISQSVRHGSAGGKIHRVDTNEEHGWKITVDGEDMITLGWKSKEVADQIRVGKTQGESTAAKRA